MEYFLHIKKLKAMSYLHYNTSKLRVIINCTLTMIIVSACTLTGTLYDDDFRNIRQVQPTPANMPKLTITVEKANVSIGIFGSGTISINWGDGSHVQTHEDLKNITYFNRSGSGSRTITISGDNITFLDCSDNQVTNINVNEIISLTQLLCSHNELTSLNVSYNIHLVRLICHRNRLRNLRVDSNESLELLNCSHNSMQGDALTGLLASLHGNEITSGKKTISINNNNGTPSQPSRTQAENRGWVFEEFE